MQLKGYDITIHRGETFTLDYVLCNKDNSPYIFSSKSVNPYILITVSSSSYSQSGRYVKNYWLKIPDNLRFYVTNAIKVDNFNFIPQIPDGEKHEDIDTYAVYYTEDDEGNKIYKRYLNNSFVDYESRFVKTFTKADTIQWVGQSYIYSVTYVDGQSMLNYLQQLHTLYYPNDELPSTKQDIYDKLLDLQDYSESLEISRELYNISVALPIIPTSTLQVIDNIRGGIE